jgi:hypothetical protein
MPENSIEIETTVDMKLESTSWFNGAMHRPKKLSII